MKNTTQTITTIESSSKFQEPTFWFDMDYYDKQHYPNNHNNRLLN